MDTLKGLNDMQREAVLHRGGPLLILAGAGSGKTLVLTRRIAHLIKEQGEAPSSILALTFTNKAAGEMKERVEAILEGSLHDLWIGTFHSIGLKILRAEHHHIGLPKNFTIYDDADQLSLIKVCIDRAGLDRDFFTPRRVQSYIDACKNEGLFPEDVDTPHNEYETRLLTLYRVYQEELGKNGAVDFGDLIIKPIRLFKENIDLLQRYKQRFRHILVDEFQDTNRAQYRLIRLILNEEENLWVVGDDDQSIYGWRGAEIRNILNLEDDFPSLSTIRLEQNYRSTRNILNAANSVIAYNSMRRGKSLWTENAEGDRIRYLLLDDEHEEARWVGTTILDLVKDGRSLNEFAVFYRTNAQSRVIEESFIRLGIPYEIVGGVRFYERKEIKDILAYVKSVLNHLDSQSILRIINTPQRGIGRATITKAEGVARSYNLTLYEGFRKGLELGVFGTRVGESIRGFIGLIDSLRGDADLSPSLFLDRILVSTGYLDMLEREEEEERIENIREFISAAKDFEDTNPEGDIYDFLDHVSLVRDIDLYSGYSNRVTLMTLHSAKGLEFPVVFIVGMEEGLFPHSRSIDDKEIEEERRLCYVGITRAKERLYLTSARERRIFGSSLFQKPSRFIDEIDPAYLERDHSGYNGFKRRDRGNGNGSAVLSTETEDGFRTGARVEHPDFGIGKVLGRQGDNIIVVAFEKAGLKKLMLSVAPLRLCG